MSTESSVPNCPECAAAVTFTGSPDKADRHAAGELLWRADTTHQPGCHYLRQMRLIGSGFAPLRDWLAAYPDVTEDWCEDCEPVIWWDLLVNNATRLELRHAEDCCAAQAATETAGMVSGGAK